MQLSETGMSAAVHARAYKPLVSATKIRNIVRHQWLGLIVLATAALTPIPASRSALGAESQCALSIDKLQLCLSRDSASRECRSLDPRKYNSTSHLQCLVSSFALIKRCFGVTIAQNAFVRIDPFRIQYEEGLFTNPSRDFYGEDRIVASCRDAVIRSGPQ
jgi:hypothetical protein